MVMLWWCLGCEKEEEDARRKERVLDWAKGREMLLFGPKGRKYLIGLGKIGTKIIGG